VWPGGRGGADLERKKGTDLLLPTVRKDESPFLEPGGEPGRSPIYPKNGS